MGEDKKLRWFDRGAAAFQKQFPGVLEKHAGPGAQPHYVCPICTEGFVRADVSSGVLTEEHVPPESLGGYGLVLTCEPCNSRSGTKLDAHAHRRKKVQETIQGAPMVEPLKVKATIGDVTLNARLKASGGQKGELVIPPGINNPQLVTVARELFRTDHKVTIEYSGDRYSELAANISWLRSAYLSAFALFGYRVVFDPAMEIVRRQILASVDTQIQPLIDTANPAIN